MNLFGERWIFQLWNCKRKK